jgi:hypothetical protein
METQQPHENHHWLMQFLGDWSCVMECPGPPGQPPVILNGRERVRALGGLWIIGEMESEMPGGGISLSVVTLGYDEQAGRFTGTFISSVMSSLWLYDGELDAERRVLALYADGPDFAAPGQVARYRDEMQLTGADERSLRSYVQDAAGVWQPMLTARFTREK